MHHPPCPSGSKYDHKMAYDDIIHFFLLERPDHRWAFVIGASARFARVHACSMQATHAPLPAAPPPSVSAPVTITSPRP